MLRKRLGMVTIGCKCHGGWHLPLGGQWLGIGWALEGGGWAVLQKKEEQRRKERRRGDARPGRAQALAQKPAAVLRMVPARAREPGIQAFSTQGPSFNRSFFGTWNRQVVCVLGYVARRGGGALGVKNGSKMILVKGDATVIS